MQNLTKFNLSDQELKLSTEYTIECLGLLHILKNKDWQFKKN